MVQKLENFSSAEFKVGLVNKKKTGLLRCMMFEAVGKVFGFDYFSDAECAEREENSSPEKDIPMLFGALGLVKKQTKRDYSPIPRGMVLVVHGDRLYGSRLCHSRQWQVLGSMNGKDNVESARRR